MIDIVEEQKDCDFDKSFIVSFTVKKLFGKQWNKQYVHAAWKLFITENTLLYFVFCLLTENNLPF